MFMRSSASIVSDFWRTASTKPLNIIPNVGSRCTNIIKGKTRTTNSTTTFSAALDTWCPPATHAPPLLIDVIAPMGTNSQNVLLNRRCYSSCPRFRFSQLGIQTCGKRSSISNCRISWASWRSVFCLRTASFGSQLTSPIHNSNRNSGSNRSNRRAWSLASIPKRTLSLGPRDDGRTSPLPRDAPVDALANPLAEELRSFKRPAFFAVLLCWLKALKLLHDGRSNCILC
jgi:hypothetical protein